MGEADVRVAVGDVVAALREAGRSEGTIRRHQAVLDRFAALLAERGLSRRATRCAWISSPARPGPGWGRCGRR